MEVDYLLKNVISSCDHNNYSMVASCLNRLNVLMKKDASFGKSVPLRDLEKRWEHFSDAEDYFGLRNLQGVKTSMIKLKNNL